MVGGRRDYRGGGDPSRLGGDGRGFLDVLKAFCPTGRPDHGGPGAVGHLDVCAGPRQDNQSNPDICSDF